ncbi:MAG: shikimate dehydrogenase [Rhodospirillales bacterium]|nr:shikimate dehydrogenase [Rhodospirillales bacterium]MBO6787623.1 shikimate dehydrogenase [Rhodospirillales bacterium]
MPSVTAKTIKAGVIGWPVEHSLSPRLHGFWLDKYGIDGVYLPLPVAPPNIEDAIRALPKLGFVGANVTVPHKEAAFKTVDTLSDTAKAIGAVNTIVCDEDGELYGDNTDAFGFIENIRAGAPGWRPSDAAAVVLGAGGAARAVIAALLDAGVPEIRLANRTKARADELLAHFGHGLTVADWDERNAAMNGAGLLVNTTTLGMTGKPPLDVDLSGLSVAAVVNDIVYAPLETHLLADATARGLTAVDGLGMLLHQARPGFEAWFGVRPDVDAALRAHVLSGTGSS